MLIGDMLVKLTDEQIKKVRELTGADVPYIKSVAEWVPGSFLKFAIVKTWSCVRCVTCLGPARKVFWCIVCVLTKPPEI